MGKIILSAAASVLLVSAAPVPSSGVPPVRFWSGDVAALTVFANDPQAVCPIAPEDGYRVVGCHMKLDGVSVIVLPNPCSLAEVERFARIACHEKAHALGWSGAHED